MRHFLQYGQKKRSLLPSLASAIERTLQYQRPPLHLRHPRTASYIRVAGFSPAITSEVNVFWGERVARERQTSTLLQCCCRAMYIRVIHQKTRTKKTLRTYPHFFPAARASVRVQQQCCLSPRIYQYSATCNRRTPGLASNSPTAAVRGTANPTLSGGTLSKLQRDCCRPRRRAYLRLLALPHYYCIYQHY